MDSHLHFSNHLAQDRPQATCEITNIMEHKFQILHHFVSIPQDDFFTISNVKISPGNSFNLRVPISRVDVCADLFSVRIINV